ncbi:MAG: SpoIIE family protein phosphatase [Fuerstiella sp.]
MTEKIDVLLVEDSDYDVAILTARLRSDGRFEVTSVPTLNKAMGKLKNGSHDVILMDLNLPDSSGLDTFIQLNTAFPDLPVVILTGDDDHDKAMKAVAAGAQDYVPKTEGDIRILSRSLLYASERNARSVIQKRQNVIDNDLAVARRIQQHLLPQQCPDIPGFETAAMCRPVEACGGDFYDFIPHQDCWDLVIADVSGHGFAPAMIMAQTQTLLRALAGRIEDVGELVTAVNQEICRDTPEGHFISMFYARLNPATCTLTYSIAGHPATIYRADGQILQLQEGGPVLGVFDDHAYLKDGETVLHPGDRLLITTDGIPETMSPNRQLFGQEQIHAQLQQQHSTSLETIQNVIEAAIQFAAPSAVQDDMTIMMLNCLRGNS